MATAASNMAPAHLVDALCTMAEVGHSDGFGLYLLSKAVVDRASELSPVQLVSLAEAAAQLHCSDVVFCATLAAAAEAVGLDGLQHKALTAALRQMGHEQAEPLLEL